MINAFFTLPLLLQALVASLFTWSMTMFGSSLVFVSGKLSKRFIAFMTALSAGIMISASFFSLLLPAFSYDTLLPSFVTVGIGFLIGGLFIPVFDMVYGLFLPKQGASLVLLTSSVGVHNIPEGMAIGVALTASYLGVTAHGCVLSLILGIGIQNYPEGLCVSFPLRNGGLSPFKAFTISHLTGAIEIPACILGAVFATISTKLLPWVLAFSAGAMITVVSSELIPSCFEENKTISSFGVILGFVLMMVLDVCFG